MTTGAEPGSGVVGVPVEPHAGGVRSYRDVARPFVAAHRGGAGLAPENTLEAFGRSSAFGVGVLETDVRVTADGVVVAFHDDDLGRVTDLVGPVAATTWEALSRARVRVDGVPGTGRVVRLEDLLDATGDALLAVDVKTAGAVRPLAAALRGHGAAHRVCVAGAWDGWLTAVRDQTGPRLTTALGWRAATALVACARLGTRPPRALAGHASFVHLPWRLRARDLLADPVLRRRVVGSAADLGLDVVAWTVDDPVRATVLMADGVAGVITDRPDLLLGGRDQHPSHEGRDLEVP